MTGSPRRLFSIAVTVLTIALPAPWTVASEDVVEYRDDALTVHVTRIPVAKALDRVARASGAAIRGRLEDSSDVTASFDAVPMQEALRRLLPKQAFALKYEGDRLAAIELLDASGVVQPPPAPAVIREPGQTDEELGVRAALSALATARRNGMAPTSPTPLETILGIGAEATPER